MAGIGDYVHYSKANYNKYGTSKDNGSQNVVTIYNNQRQICLDRAKQGLLNHDKYIQIENFLNGMMYGQDSNGKQYDDQAIQELQQRVLTEFNKRFSTFGVDFDQGLNVYYKGKTQVSQKKKISANGLKQYLQIIQRMVNGSIATNKNFNVEEARNTIRQLENYINSNADNPSQMISFTDNKTLFNLIDSINKVLKMQSIPHNVAIGEVFEIWLAIASQYAENKSDQITDELLKELIQGAGRSKLTISADKFSEELVDLSSILSKSGFGAGQWNYIDDNNSYEFSSPTQDKLDVIFQWEGDKLGVSAKSYGFVNSNNIHLLSGSSLLYLISKENTDFVNHWLNCLAQSPDDSQLSDDIRSSAHFTMKLSIFTQALLGNKGALANTLILNDRKHHHIYVRDMNSIVSNIIQLSKNSSNLQGVTIDNYPTSVLNQWQGDSGAKSDALARMRITKLLADIHKQKISISMSANSLPKNLT